MKASVVTIIKIFLILSLIPWLMAAKGGKPPPAPVKVATVIQRALAPTSWVAGTVVSRDDARIAAELSGRLIWVAEVGTQMKEGDVVAKLENTQQKLKVDELNAVVAKEKARWVYLRQEVKRLQSLARENNAAKNRLEQSQADRDVAKSELSAARSRVQLAKEQLNRSKLRAPFNGIVTERLKQKGEWVSHGDTVVRLIDPQSLEIRARVPISSKPYLKVGQSLRLRTTQTVNPGTVRTLVPVGDDKSRLMDLRLDIELQNWSVGQSVRIAIPTAIPKQVMALPRDALVLRRSGTSVYKIDAAGKAQRVSVVTGRAEGALIEVSGALVLGDKVVIRGSERLRSGQAVKIIGATDK